MSKTIRFNQINLVCFIIFFFIGGQVLAQKENENKKVDNPESRFDKFYTTLLAEPKWLFDGVACPMEIFPVQETKLNYRIESCGENPATCLNNCKNNDGNSCYALALLIQQKKGLDQDNSEALFLRACKLGMISGCTNRAAKLFDSEDEKTVTCAAKTFEKTCEKNDPWGCAMYGLALSLGAGIPQNNQKALEVLKQPCKYKEEHDSCQAAKNLIEKIKESQTKKN